MRKFVALSLLLLTPCLQAEELRSNVASFTSTVSRELDNDTANATLFIELTDANPSRLAERINPILSHGVKLIKQESDIDSVNSHYTVNPVYGKNDQFSGWRARGELTLSTQNFSSLTHILANAQKVSGNTPLQLASISYSLSPQTRETVNNELIQEGLQAFRQRAEIVSKAWGSKAWKLIAVDIRSPNSEPFAYSYAADVSSSKQKARATSPTIEGGKSILSLEIQGNIQLE